MYHPYFTWTNNPVAPVVVSTGFGEAFRRIGTLKDKFAKDHRNMRDDRDIVAIVALLAKSGLL